MATYRQALVELMSQMCADDRFGYHIGTRPIGGNWDVAMFDGTISLPAGDYDCSNSIIQVFRSLGIDCGDPDGTRGIRGEFETRGLTTTHSRNNGSGITLQAGDLILWENIGDAATPNSPAAGGASLDFYH